MAAHASIFARPIPWIKEPGGLQSTGLDGLGRGAAKGPSLTMGTHIPGQQGRGFQNLPGWASLLAGVGWAWAAS